MARKPAATRTLNPLHFEDLEPKRFEDLARQLVYDLRDWHSIEAIGRSGADEGIDIRAIERVAGDAPADDRPTDEAEAEEPNRFEERTWTIQCKRERQMGPARLQKVVEECVPQGGIPPYGFGIVAACDFSLKARERFRTLMNARGVQDSFLWGKAELEDRLFQPRHDHLLFAYFGISLQAKRRSVKTTFSGRLVTKRRLLKALDCDVHERGHTPVLVRDAADADYPYRRPGRAGGRSVRGRWRYYDTAGHLRVDHLALIVHEYLAWADLDTKQWDAYEKVDVGIPSHPLLWMSEEETAQRQLAAPIRRFWNVRVPEQRRAHLYILGFIHYDRILLVDEVGDCVYPGPHLVVDCTGLAGPFGDIRERIQRDHLLFSDQGFFPGVDKRTTFFPEPLPEISEEEFQRVLAPGSSTEKPLTT